MHYIPINHNTTDILNKRKKVEILKESLKKSDIFQNLQIPNSQTKNCFWLKN